MWLQIFQLGITSLLLHKLRSLLTMLGVILGVGSVIAMLAIGEGSKRESLERIRHLGATNVFIRSVKPDQMGSDDDSSTEQSNSRVLQYGLKYNDLDRLTATLPTVNSFVPISLNRKRAQARHRYIKNASILGTTPDHVAVKSLEISRGRFLSPIDMDKGTNVAVLSAGAAETLFSYEDPIGKLLRLGKMDFRVIGVLKPKGQLASVGNAASKSFNKEIYIPITAARSRFGELHVIITSGNFRVERVQLSEITLAVNDENLVSETAAMAQHILASGRKDMADIEIQVPLELLKQAEAEKRTWNLVLGSIAGISLLVGGIGIMNIMLATVTERTREIGIRRALGAKQRDITIQFLVESVILSATGGLLGIVLGVCIPVTITYFSDIDAYLQWWPIPLTFLISVGLGILFGVYPARRAALMDPIEALRHE